MSAKPSQVIDRDVEWGDLRDFVSSRSRGLRIGIVYGRRRQGKSFLLRRLCAAVGDTALYTMALEQERQPALDRFADAVGVHRGLGSSTLRFAEWDRALTFALDSRLVVIDEFPYLLPHSPELSSVVQSLYDQRREDPSAPRLILCGSAISVMNELLSGTRALRGRAVVDLCVKPFGYRAAARLWKIDDPEVAFHVHAVLGGTPGYRDLIEAGPPRRREDLGRWLAGHALNPSHALFTETDYLLREDPRVTDRALYHSVLTAISAGASTPSRIAQAVGRPERSLAHPLAVLETAGFVRRTEDVLLQRRARFTVTDPIVRFQLLITRPRLTDFEERRTLEAWRAAEATFSSQILGPHFEELARDWTATHAPTEALGGPLGEIGPSVVNDPAGRSQHELDVVALAPGEVPRHKHARVALLGEAKWADRPRTVTDLRRLEHIRGLLVARGTRAERGRLVLFGRSGFEPELARQAARRDDVLLVDLADLYRPR
ncbi:MAG: ATP-binding protein [Streptosporangiales bacterium]|nr:ATP-binding protein [Streptosporangiales bacterium]